MADEFSRQGSLLLSFAVHYCISFLLSPIFDLLFSRTGGVLFHLSLKCMNLK